MRDIVKNGCVHAPDNAPKPPSFSLTLAPEVVSSEYDLNSTVSIEAVFPQGERDAYIADDDTTVIRVRGTVTTASTAGSGRITTVKAGSVLKLGQ